MRTPISPALVGMLAQDASNGSHTNGAAGPAISDSVVMEPTNKAPTNKPTATSEAAMAASTGGPDVLSKLVLPASYAESLEGVKKKLVHVPVRRPHRTWWWWASSAFVMRVATLSDENGGQKETYLVGPELMAEYPGEVVPATIHGAMNRQGTFFIICARLPGPDGRLDAWTQSLRQALVTAEKEAVRTPSNRELGAYDIFTAPKDIEPPKWPEEPWKELVMIAFRDLIIDTHEHPILRRLRGEV